MSVECIYGLVDPREPHVVRYVGWTTNPRRRLLAHISSAKSVTHLCYRTHRGNWIRKLLREGVEPVLVVLEESPQEGWAAAERAWIFTLRLLGFPLTNMCDGGEGRKGYRLSPEARAAISAKQRGKSVSAEVVARRTAAFKARLNEHGPSEKELAARRKWSRAGVLARDETSTHKVRLALIGETAISRLGDSEWLAEQYVVRGLTAEQIAVQLGVCKRTVLIHLRAAGVPLRPSGGVSKKVVPCPHCDRHVPHRALLSHVRGHEKCWARGHDRDPGPSGACRICGREWQARYRATLAT